MKQNQQQKARPFPDHKWLVYTIPNYMQQQQKKLKKKKNTSTVIYKFEIK